MCWLLGFSFFSNYVFVSALLDWLNGLLSDQYIYVLVFLFSCLERWTTLLTQQRTKKKPLRSTSCTRKTDKQKLMLLFAIWPSCAIHSLQVAKWQWLLHPYQWLLKSEQCTLLDSVVSITALESLIPACGNNHHPNRPLVKEMSFINLILKTKQDKSGLQFSRRKNRSLMNIHRLSKIVLRNVFNMRMLL